MAVIVTLMILAFATVGIFLVHAGIKDLIAMKRRRVRLIGAEGVVRNVETERSTSTTQVNGRSKMRTCIKYFPVIMFHTSDGKERLFKSEIGQSRMVRRVQGKTIEPTSPYSTGEKIKILYDPLEEIKPLIDSWGGLYGMGSSMAVAGFIFVGASVGMVFAFGPKVLAEFNLS